MTANSIHHVDMEKEKTPDISRVESGTHEVTPTITYTAAEEAAVKRKQDLVILPLCAGIYFLCNLDRSNIGNTRILNSSTHNDMQTETHTTATQFNIALMIFLIGYAFLMFTWGAITISLGGVNNYSQVTAVRFLLGMSEAGLFPGLVYYLTFWYKTSERSVRVAFILASATLAGAFGGAIAYGVGHMNQALGHSAWRWLFIVEGAPSCLSAFFVWFFLPDYPEEWHAAGSRDRDIALHRLGVEGSKSRDRSMSWEDARATLVDWRLYGHYLVYFGVSVPFSSLSLFTPAIVSGLGYFDLKAQLMTVPPYAVAYVTQILVSYSADRFNARGLHAAALATVGAVGFIASACLPPDDYLHRYGCLIVASAGSFACIPPMLGWLTSNVYSTASVGLAIAINVGFGAGCGQIPGVWIYKADEKSRGYPTGHWTNAGMLLFVAAGCLGLRVLYGVRNARMVREAGGQEVRLFRL
ncbi:major facilitator superfamily domain-containing protein [Coniochaeta sp. 2T2.1]|nr:major facilitator superfamily domain-containing protein [Coniochaeta sp. 2T2.1]